MSGRRLFCKTVHFVGRALLLLLLAGQTTQVTAQGTGKRALVRIPNSEESIRFRPIPKTTVPIVTGSPDGKDQLKFETVGFFLSEAEITQAQFAAVLGQEKLDQVRGRKNRATGERYFVDANKPIYLVTFQETLEFCQALQEMVQDEVSGFFKPTFRIPTQYEWQYACKARLGPEAKEYPYFAYWPVKKKNGIYTPDIPDVPNHWVDPDLDETDAMSGKTLQELCESIWKEKEYADARKKFGERFVGTQNQVMEMFRSAGGDGKENQEKKFMIVLTEFLKEGMGLKHKLFEGERDIMVRTAAQAIPNNWELRQMNSNVFEWAMHCNSADPAEAHAVWEKCKLEEIDVEGAVMGGGYMTDNWEKYTIYSFTKVENEQLFVGDEDRARENELGQSLQSGIRLLYERGLDEKWPATLRQLTVSEEVGKVDHQNLVRIRIDVPQAVEKETGDALRAARARARIDYYRALAYMRAKDTDNAMKAFKEAEPVLAKNDDYFKFLSAVMEEDGK